MTVLVGTRSFSSYFDVRAEIENTFLAYSISCTATPMVIAIVLQGWAVTLTFTVTESLPPVLTSSDWRFTTSHGTHLIAAEGPRFTFGADLMSVTIDPVHFVDEGTYTLNAHNEAGFG